MRLSLAYARRAYTRAVAFRPALSAPPRRLLRSGNTALSPSSPGGESVVAPKKRLSDILNNRGSAAKSGAYTFNVKGSVKEAIAHFTKHHTGVCVAVNDNGEVRGIFTARDLLRFMNNKFPRAKDGPEQALSACVEELVTTQDRIIFGSPNDSVKHTREIMFQHKIRHIPVIKNGNVLGIVNGGELSDSAFSVVHAGGKKAFMKNVLGRLGLPEGTRANFDLSLPETPTNPEELMSDDPLSASIDSGIRRFGITLSEYALPHPFKHPDGVGASRRDFGPGDLCEDMSLCEDAHYSITVDGGLVPANTEPSKHVYMVVADGVGSWRQYGVDPRLYAHTLVSHAKTVIESDALQRQLISEQGDRDLGSLFTSEPIHPLDVIMDASLATNRERITGSSTICVASIDNNLNQLTVSNLGDCGLMVVRHMDSEIVGYMREKNKARHERKSDHQIAFLSQQQLKSFNLPYQLGFSGIDEHAGNFERPGDATTFSIPIFPGDVIILATDGLFDNIDIDDIVHEVETWEDEWFGLNVDGLYLRDEHPTDEQKATDALAKGLVMKARALSLDKTKDSPFALLAKDNDIMWSGGMPDDTTVLCARIYQPREEGKEEA